MLGGSLKSAFIIKPELGYRYRVAWAKVKFTNKDTPPSNFRQ